MAEMIAEAILANIRDTADRAKDIYTTIEKTLEKRTSEIQLIFKEIVDQYAEDYGLLLQNDSSKAIKLYDLSSRVKNGDSFREKLIRNQYFYELEKLSDSKIKIAIIDKFDDLIGLRFLVSLSCDCESIYKLLKDHVNDLKEKNIIIYNFETNPERMQNDRNIYRLKGMYKKYKFELQIKSKVDSAWADIEHILFYKNFNFSYVQGTNKTVMNRIGSLLEQADKLMVDVRKSEEGYEEKADELEFDQYLGKRYVNLIRNKIGTAFVLTEHKKLLYSIFSDFERPLKKNIIELKDKPMHNDVVEFDFDDNLKGDKLCFNYQELKRHSLELLVFEIIYYEWVSTNKGEYFKIQKEDLKQYLELIFRNAAKCYQNDKEVRNLDNYNEWLVKNFLSILEYEDIQFGDRLFLMNKKKMEQVALYWDAHCEAYNDDKAPDFEEYEKHIVLFDKTCLKYLFNEMQIDYYVKEIIEVIESYDNDDIKHYCFKMFVYIQKNYGKNETDNSGKEKEPNSFLVFLEKVFEEINEGVEK